MLRLSDNFERVDGSRYVIGTPLPLMCDPGKTCRSQGGCMGRLVGCKPHTPQAAPDNNRERKRKLRVRTAGEWLDAASRLTGPARDVGTACVYKREVCVSVYWVWVYWASVYWVSVYWVWVEPAWNQCTAVVQHVSVTDFQDTP